MVGVFGRLLFEGVVGPLSLLLEPVRTVICFLVVLIRADYLLSLKTKT